MKNISTLSECCGCGVCAISCPKKIIEIRQNVDGFYSAFVNDKSACLSCGICIKVCPALHDKPCELDAFDIKTYSAKSINTDTLKFSSSGGMAFEIGKHLLNSGYKVCACSYDSEKNIVKHVICRDETELRKTSGSKYIQSYTFDGFSNFNKAENYIVIGTPCQIDAVRRWARMFNCEDNFILVDLFCHGVPTMLMYKKYCDFVQKNIGKIRNVLWRNKDYGWHKSSHMRIDGDRGVFLDNPVNPIKGFFFYAFLRDFILAESCYKCKYKHTSSAADIRLGDFWGDKYANDEDGMNLVYVFTKKGEDIINAIRGVARISEEKVGAGLLNQPSKSPSKPLLYRFMLYLYRTSLDVRKINFLFFIYGKFSKLYKIMFKKA